MKIDENLSDFEPPAPIPRTTIPSIFEVIKSTLTNPLEVWGQPSYTLPWIKTKFLNERMLIVNDPDFIHYVLVENAKNYRMATVRQLILRPILRDGLLTAEGDVWKRSRKSVAPVFAPRHAKGFADLMHKRAKEYVKKYEQIKETDLAVDMTELTYEILAETLFSNDIASDKADLAQDVEKLLHTMGRVDPLDLIKTPKWVPRFRRLLGFPIMRKFRKIVSDTAGKRLALMEDGTADIPDDFLTLLLRQLGPEGLKRKEIEDNIITFIGAGHETTARALAWTLYCVANSCKYRNLMEAEADKVHNENIDPVDWPEHMPWTRAAFEEAMRLYPPAPSINRAALADDKWVSHDGKNVTIEKDTTVLIMPWTLHRHEKLWEKPRVFRPERFLPENKAKLHRFQYLPFGAGPRVCIGATFALQEAIIALGVLMKSYRFHCPDTTKPWPVQKLTVQPAGGLRMSVSKRE
ncbi:cytochrome P450 [Lentilitoribacter sp. Alg239-R112]|uniref:cytochrome P450 n=1 Tax=Lentilitoribacter sp. Alg239-R112 TaxID=2305987 RepID=UPI0013A6CCF8|nr:cytochrome P450 [Lentilitoribacter sp. Alg239-R112]